MHPVTPYVIRAEAGYAAFELLFGVLFLVVAAIPLRRGEHLPEELISLVTRALTEHWAD